VESAIDGSKAATRKQKSRDHKWNRDGSTTFNQRRLQTRHRTGVDSTVRNQFSFNGKPQASLSTTVACGLPFRNSPEITSGLNEFQTHAVSLRSLGLTCHTLQKNVAIGDVAICRV
jgi:hypothetical protein